MRALTSLAVAWLLTIDGGSIPPPLPDSLELEVGEARVFRVPGVQRIAVSSATMYQVRTLDRDDLAIEGFETGRTTVLIWLANGKRRSVLLTVVPRHTPPPAVRVKGETRRAARLSPDGGVSRGEVEVFEIPEELHDLREVSTADGGVVLEGFTADGARRVITLTPRH